MKEKSVKMNKRESKYNIPNGWTEVPLKDILILEYGKSLTAKDRVNGNYKVWGSSGIVGTHNDFLVEAPAIIIGRKGSVGTVHYSHEKCWPIDTTYYIKPSKSLSSKFIFYLLKQLNLSILDKSTTIPGLNRESVYSLNILLPPLNEQYRIVNRIEELFSELDKAEETLQKELKRLKIYELAVLNKIFKSREEGWAKFKFKDLFEFIGGGTPSKKQKQYWNGNIHWATVKDISAKYLNTTQDKITKEGLLNSSTKKAQKGDVILVTRIAPGRVSISNIETTINQDLKVVLPKEKNLSSTFIYYLLNAYYKDIINLSSGTTVKGINLSQLNNIPVYIPSCEKQDEIIQKLEHLYSFTSNISKEIEDALKHIIIERHAILRKAFKGKLVSQDIEDIPASNILEIIKKEIYLSNQKKTIKMKTIKSPKKQLIEVFKDTFKENIFTFEDIKTNIVISYEELKKQLFILLENNLIQAQFDPNIGKIIYRISYEN